jgi:hypothetical protein
MKAELVHNPTSNNPEARKPHQKNVHCDGAGCIPKRRRFVAEFIDIGQEEWYFSADVVQARMANPPNSFTQPTFRFIREIED